MLRFFGRFLLTLGLCLWLGSLAFFIVGVAPVNFGTAREWNLTGSNPSHPDQVVHWRTVGGEITGRSIQRLNMAEWAGLALCLAGTLLLLAHRPTKVRKSQLGLFVVMGILLALYGVWMGGRLQSIRNSGTLDFSDNSTTKMTETHQTFDSMHEWYSRLAGVNALLLVVQVVLASAPGRERR